MSHRRSRIMSAATAAYGVYALARPGHLASAMESDAHERPSYDRLARAYGVRDVVVSALGVAGTSSRLVRTSMALRVAGDLTDAVVLSMRAPNAKVRSKVLAVTIGWAALETAALLRDRRTA